MQLTPQVLKSAVTKALNELLAPIQEAFNASHEWQVITDQAYPPEEAKKKKTPKDKGSKYPGAAQANVEAQPDGSVEGQDKDQVDLGSGANQRMKDLNLDKVNGN